MDQVKYILSNLLYIPLLPIVYFQGKQIYKSVPKLPEATHPQGFAGNGKRKIKLISIGESTIAGVGVVSHAQGLTGHLASTLAANYDATVDWRVVAKSGYTVKKVTQRLVPEIATADPDILFIGIGGNDTFKLNSPTQWRKDIEALIEKLKSTFPDTPIVFANVPPIKSFPAFTRTIKFVLGRQVDLLHEELVKAVEQKERVWYNAERIVLSKWLTHFKDEKYTVSDFFSDGVHPSKLTYKTWGVESAKFIIDQNIL